MTDKEKIRKEVERLKEKYQERVESVNYLSTIDTEYWGGVLRALNEVLSFIDSLQEEPISKVEEYIRSYTKCCSNEIGIDTVEDKPLYYPWLTPDHAREVANIARDEVIEDACEWLSEKARYYFFGMAPMPGGKFIEDFRKALEKGDKDD